MKKIVLFLIICSFGGFVFGQKVVSKKEKAKKGFSMGGVPVVAYDADVGFKYGALVNLYHYGDGSNYPNYNHSLYLEWSRTTKGSGINQLIYDALTLIPKTRLTFDLSYLTEQALNFYGFNGYQVDYNPGFEITGGSEYISRMYYRHSRKLFRIKADFQGVFYKKSDKKLRWLAGVAHYRNQIASVDINRLNKGKKDDFLPDTALLYDKYVDWGIIPAEQAEGGNVTTFKIGAVFDSRDNEANPNKGLWSEALLIAAPGFLGNDYAYMKLLLSHRQYFTLVPDYLTFAYRLSYQTKLAGEIPFYMLPYMIDSKSTQNGLGGAKNLRGILRNRVVGDGVAFGNFEFRSKFFKTVIFNQNFYLGVNLFADLGVVTMPYKFSSIFDNMTNLTPEQQKYRASFNAGDESLHVGYGGGIRFVINNNFIVAVDYGLAANKQDGTSGLYIGLDYLF